MAKVGFVSLGCPKNLVDSEVMLGLLSENGHEITHRQEEAEIIVVNTCGFIQSAKQESIEAILEMAQQKQTGNCRRLIVAGCLVERYRNEITSQIPEVDAVIGTNQIPQILQVCDGDSPQPAIRNNGYLFLYSERDPRILTTPPYTAYMKIAEGCDHPCTFCVIPQMRGSFRSRPAGSILAEARKLASRGVVEINLIGQDTTMYGEDLGPDYRLPHLLKELAAVDGIQWIRFLYAYPNKISNELLRVMAETPKVCKYIDVPLQHASRSILKRMKRGGNLHSLTNLVHRIRRTVPGVTVRTSMIVGFPGETEEDFQDLVRFVEEVRFDRMGVFPYSDEEDAASHQLPGKVPAAVKKHRRAELMKLQRRISRTRNSELVGRIFPVIVEGLSKESDLLWQGRLQSQAPDIDGVVYLNDGALESAQAGDVRNVKITKAYDYDLLGTVLP
jgi:ribosomal protein S12 methylthiotransferase